MECHEVGYRGDQQTVEYIEDMVVCLREREGVYTSRGSSALTSPVSSKKVM